LGIPGRLIVYTHTPVPAAALASASPIAGSRPELRSGSRPQDPGCSTRNQPRASGAVPWSGSPSRREVSLQVLVTGCLVVVGRDRRQGTVRRRTR
jgi:hypothetical protein